MMMNGTNFNQLYVGGMNRAVVNCQNTRTERYSVRYANLWNLYADPAFLILNGTAHTLELYRLKERHETFNLLNASNNIHLRTIAPYMQLDFHRGNVLFDDAEEEIKLDLPDQNTVLAVDLIAVSREYAKWAKNIYDSQDQAVLSYNTSTVLNEEFMQRLYVLDKVYSETEPDKIVGIKGFQKVIPPRTPSKLWKMIQEKQPVSLAEILFSLDYFDSHIKWQKMDGESLAADMLRLCASGLWDARHDNNTISNKKM